MEARYLKISTDKLLYLEQAPKSQLTITVYCACQGRRHVILAALSGIYLKSPWEHRALPLILLRLPTGRFFVDSLWESLTPR